METMYYIGLDVPAAPTTKWRGSFVFPFLLTFYMLADIVL